MILTVLFKNQKKKKKNTAYSINWYNKLKGYPHCQINFVYIMSEAVSPSSLRTSAHWGRASFFKKPRGLARRTGLEMPLLVVRLTLALFLRNGSLLTSLQSELTLLIRDTAQMSSSCSSSTASLQLPVASVTAVPLCVMLPLSRSLHSMPTVAPTPTTTNS